MLHALVIAALTILVPLLHAQQVPAAAPQKARVEGQVVKTGTGQPLKNARVVLEKAESSQHPSVTLTDARGRFTLKNIEPGRYRLWVERNGYLRQEYGQERPSRPGTILALAPGQHLSDVVVRLLPAAVIAGRVYDEDGEAVPGVRVQALRFRYVEGRRLLLPAAQAVTNDLGEYRVYGLAPGRYTIGANHPPALAWAVGGEAASNPGGDQNPSEASYAPTYYPGTSDPGSAVPLKVQAGEEIRAIDFTLLPTRTVRIRGQVFNAVTGQPGFGASLFVLPRNQGAGAVLALRNPTNVGSFEGTFEIGGVTPGSYHLVAFWPHAGKQYATRVPLEVGSTNIEDLRLTIGPGADLTGRIDLEGQALAGELDLTELRVSLQPTETLPFAPRPVAVRADGGFTLDNLAQGDYRLALQGLPEDFYLKAARLGGYDVLTGGLTLSGGQPPGRLKLVLSSAGARIEGGVLDADQQAFGGASVVLVPDPRRRQRRELYKSTTTDQYGRFTLGGIPPGAYRLFAWEELEPGVYYDADFFLLYQKLGETVSLREAEGIAVQLDLLPATSIFW